MLYAAFFFGPLTAYVTLRARSLWPAVVLHDLNNFPYEAWAQRLR